jgi:hypothetical protein
MKGCRVTDRQQAGRDAQRSGRPAMSTTHPVQVPTINPALNPIEREKYLNELLDVRSKLAETAAYYRAHGLSEDAEDLSIQQYRVEATISWEFPDTYVEEWPNWVARDAELMHEAPVLTPECPVCQAIARRGRINLVAPEVA